MADIPALTTDFTAGNVIVGSDVEADLEAIRTAFNDTGLKADETVDCTVQQRIVGGSVGVPGLGFVGDTNTGMYQPAGTPDEVHLTAGGRSMLNVANHKVAAQVCATARTAITISSASQAITLTTSYIDLTLNTSWTGGSIGSPPVNTASYWFKIIQDPTGGRTITWPPAVKWGDAGAPTLSTAPNAADLIYFFTDALGNMFGALVGTGYL